MWNAKVAICAPVGLLCTSCHTPGSPERSRAVAATIKCGDGRAREIVGSALQKAGIPWGIEGTVLADISVDERNLERAHEALKAAYRETPFMVQIGDGPWLFPK